MCIHALLYCIPIVISNLKYLSTSVVTFITAVFLFLSENKVNVPKMHSREQIT